MAAEPPMKPRVLFVMNRFRTYDLRMYEVLAEPFALRVVFVGPPPPTEVMPPELAARIETWTLDGDDDKLAAQHVRRNAALFRLLVRVGRGCDLFVTGTSDSWKTRVVYAAARACRVPIAVRKEKWRDHLGAQPTGARGLYWRFQSRVTDYIEQHSEAVLVGGSKAAEYLVARGVPAERIAPFRYLHPDLAPKPLRADVVADLRRRKAGRVAFLYLGRVMHQKGLEHLVRAFLRLVGGGRDAVLFVVGDPIRSDTGRGMVSVEYYENCKRLAADEPRVMFFPAAPSAHVQDYYAAADVFMHPHQAEVDGVDVHEGWGNVITEAASMGKAIIASDRVAAAFDIVTDGVNGFRVSVDRLEDELVLAMARFVDDPSLAARFGTISRRRFEEFVDPRLNVASLARLIAR